MIRDAVRDFFADLEVSRRRYPPTFYAERLELDTFLDLPQIVDPDALVARVKELIEFVADRPEVWRAIQKIGLEARYWWVAASVGNGLAVEEFQRAAEARE